MNDPIMLSPHDIWNIFLGICGGIVAVSAALAVIIKVIGRFKEPDKKQDERITRLEEEVKGIHTRLDDGDKHFKRHDDALQSFEISMKRRDKIMIESLQVLIEHSIDGNNIEVMKEQKHKIDEYLLEK
ncbi:MAG: hypothetical protein K6E34_04650 [Lachnospiraceae bacterium]|nr:hypothetical protein [Lachnospiraceae bacterium]